MTDNKFSEFEDTLCNINKVIHRYFDVKKIYDATIHCDCDFGSEATNIILHAVNPKLDQYEKQIIELSMKLANIKTT